MEVGTVAIILACGNKIRIYQVEKSRSTLQCSFISEIDAEASKLGEYATNMNIIEELDGYRNEKIYFILTHGSGVLYKTVSIPLGSLDLDPDEAASEDERQQTLLLLKNKYILSGYDPNDYEIMVVDRTIDANVYLTLAFAPIKLISSIIELCKYNEFDLLGIVPDLKMLKKIINCGESQYFIVENSRCTLVTELGLLILNGLYPLELMKEFLLQEASNIFENSYLPGPVISDENIGSCLFLGTGAAERYVMNSDISLETAAALAVLYNEKEGQVNTDGIVEKFKRFFTKK